MANAFDEFDNQTANAFDEFDAASLPERKYRSNTEEAIRQLGLTARYGLEGIGGTADFLATPIREGLNALSPGRPFEQGIGTTVSDMAGLPKPESGTERVVGDISRAVAGGGGLIKGAKTLSTKASGSTKAALEWMAANPGLQLSANIGAGGGGGLVREAGAGPGWQFAAGLLGGLAVPGGVAATKYVSSRLADIGGTVGAAFGSERGANRIARDVINTASEAETDAARQYLVQILRQGGTDYLPNSPQGAAPTSAQTLAEAQMGSGKPQVGGGLIRLQSDLTGAPGVRDVLTSVQKQQEEAMLGPLQRMAGGPTREAQDAAQVAVVESRGDVTGPLRERALDRANISGVLVPEYLRDLSRLDASHTSALKNEGMLRTEAANIDRLAPTVREPVTASTGNYPAATVPDAGATLRARYHAGSDKFVPSSPHSEPRAGFKVETEAGRQAKLAADDFAKSAVERKQEMGAIQGQLDRLSSNGLKPLRSDDVLRSIEARMSEPGSMSRDLVQAALGYARERIGRIPQNNGSIDARNLYAARKDINEEIRNYLLTKPASDKTLAAGADTKIKAMIDDAIENAGGSGWKNYLSTYRTMSEKLDKLKVAQALTDKLQNERGKITAASLLDVLGRGENALLKTKIGAPRNTTLDKVLGDDAAHVRGVGKHLARDEEVARIVSRTRGGEASNLAGKEIPRVPIPLSRTATITNFITKLATSGAETPIAKALVRALRDPHKLMEILEQPVYKGYGVPETAGKAALAEALRQQQ